MKYFVYYEDDYAENGGVGLEEFDSASKACAFISERSRRRGVTLDDLEKKYTLIRGREQKIAAKSVVRKVETERGAG